VAGFLQHSGLRPEGAAVASVSLTDLHLQDSEYGRIAGQLLQEVRNETGIEAAGITSIQPLDGYFSAIQISSLGNQGVAITDPNAFQVTVSPDYFSAIGTQLIAGSVSTSSAKDDVAQCILSRSLAASLFHKSSPIGESVYTSPVSQSQTPSFDAKNACRVTGIAEDARLISLRSPAPKAIYNVIHPEAFSSPVVTIIARGHTDALAVTALRNAAKQVVPNSSWVRYWTVTELKNSDLNRERMLISLAGAFAVLTLMLTTLGLYGLLMRSVTLRLREIGIRIALGASKRSIVISTVKRTAYGVGAGIVLGIAVAVVITNVTQRLLGDQASINVSIYLIGIGLITVVSFISAYIPTKRAIAVDPMKALRNE
jgi:putative ABC transport system permease protein